MNDANSMLEKNESHVNTITLKKLTHQISRWACLMLFIAWQSHAMAASDWVSEKAYYEDVSATLDFHQVKNQRFVKYDDILNKSYSSSAFWVRIKLDAARLHDGEKHGHH